ncbi:MAG: DUF1566 domain-containing protein [Opitutaceae bacterium]|nr:DUF1566 domain-containing protein [Opitutaceae bacterium]
MFLAGAGSVVAHSWHDDGPVSPAIAAARAELRAQLVAEQRAALTAAAAAAPAPGTPRRAALSAPPPGYGPVLAASFGAFRPRVRSYWDATTFYVESDNMPDPVRMPNLMVGITSWQQQVPLPTSYFAATTNPERDPGSIGFGKPNVWRLPLVPTPAASPLPINAANFLRGAIGVGADGIAIFNPRNNGGRYSYEIGELDLYGGHCGLADDYHYHLAPVHLQAVVGTGQPVAWALDGYPIYGYTEPDGSPRQALDANGGHEHGPWAYHYHAIGSAATGPQNPYLPTAFRGTVVNFGGQVDGQPEVQAIRANNTGGYTARAVPGARIVAFKHPVALETDAGGHLVESATGTPSPDQFLLRVAIGNATYDQCWRINRSANPRTLTITWRLPDITPTTTTYNNNNNRLTAYAMGSPSLLSLPDTGQTIDATAVFGEDSDYTINPPAYTDHGDGTVTDRVTGLMWQKTDAGESTWDEAVARAAGITTGGYTDWRLPTPTELLSLAHFNPGNPAAAPAAFFANHPAGAAEYWWTSDTYGADATRVWCVNAGGGLGPKPKAETLSAGGTLRYHARYVRGARPGNGHNYVNHLDGTITDLDTGLMWTQVPAAAMTWTEALRYAENLAFAGYTDWRLPNIKELQSLTDYTLATATSAATALAPLNRVLFPTATTPAAAYWSSTALRGGGNAVPTSAWLIEFGYNNAVPAASGPNRAAQGIVSYELMTSSHRVFAVRGPVTRASEPGTTGTARLVNLATRVILGGEAGVPITGFVVAGTGAKAVLLRGVGPALAGFGVAGPVIDPRLALVGASGATLASNDNWLAADAAAMAGAGAFALAAGSRDAALVTSVPAGAYTVPLDASGTAAGTALLEIYDLAPATNARLVNASTRAFVGAGENVLIPGFVVGGEGALRVLLRAVGPTLATFGVTGALANPVITLYRAGTAIAANDDWSTNANAAEIPVAGAAVGAFALPAGSRDAVILTTLSPGAYTAIVSGAGTSGTALVELYAVP